jgi:very-short-patch-repair endonuclease
MREGEARSRQFARRLRKKMTEAEVVLWTFLRRKNLNGWKFRRQHPIGPHIADFACVAARLVVEVDGATHWTPDDLAHGKRRTAFMEGQGWSVVRVTNLDVFENLNGVWLTIERELPPPAASPPPPPPANEAHPPPPRGAGAGGGGRAGLSAHGDVAWPNSVDRSGGSLGWGSRFGQARQRDFIKANARAKRLRSEMTDSEKTLRRLLREVPEARFRKQVAIDDRVFDFAAFGARLLIELDGAVHDDPEVAARDAEKQRRAEAAGFRVLRITNADVSCRPSWVIEQVRACLTAPHPPAPAPQGGGGESQRRWRR